MGSRTYLGNMMYGDTATWHSGCMNTDILAMQETVGSCTWVRQEDPESVKYDTNGVSGVRCMVMWDCVACHVMRVCMV